MIEMSLSEIARVTGGRVDGDATAAAVVVSAPAYLDSRRPVPGGLFVALVGERSDGHDHADGAPAVLGSRPTGRPTVVVPDPVVALGRLARHVVDRVGPTVLALTGSQGKTGTKDLLAQLLPGAVATDGNLNNELGVPLTVLRADARTEQLVLEMGARGVGHLSYLCDVAPPDVAAVLAVGTAHVGEFGSAALVAVAKGELVEALPAWGVAVLNADDPRVLAMATRTRARVLTFGVHGDVRWRALSLDRLGCASFELGYDGTWLPVSLRQSGGHQVANAAAAAAMALAVGEPLAAVATRLSAAVPLSTGRLAPVERPDGVVVIDDSYNANPASVRAALQTLVAVGAHRTGRTIAVLGEMRELGALAASSHEAVGRVAATLGVDVVLAIGAAAGAVVDGFGPAGGVQVADRDAALAWLDAELAQGDVVLVKASRAAELDRLVVALLSSQGAVKSQAAPTRSSSRWSSRQPTTTTAVSAAG